MKLKLTSKKEEQAGVVSFIFQSEEKIIFQPGQYLRYKLDHPNADERGVNRFFSISAAPEEGFIMLSTKFAEDGSSFKKYLLSLTIGAEIEAFGPFGDFILPETTEGLKLCFIAGGIGITPFRSILVHLKQQKKAVNITLIYANRTPDITFKEELEEIKESMDGLNINYVIDPIRVDREKIKELVPNYKERIFYVSGPEPMVQGILKILEEMGMEKEQLKRDFFPGYTGI